jgi:hypothetical protein
MTLAQTTDKRRMLIAAFDDRIEAERALDDLAHAGFERADLGFALRGSDVGHDGMITDETGAGDAQGAAKGAVAGAALGGLIGAVASLTVPGFGPVYLAGLLYSVLGFGAAGAATGGMVGAMAALANTEEEAHFLTYEFDAGKALVAVRTNVDNADQAAQILLRHGGTCAHATTASGLRDAEKFRHHAE